MKKLLLILSIISGLVSCAQDEFSNTGNIYGVVTVKETAEPMRATGVELYLDGSLLLKTVTYDDGHYEFENLSEGEYRLKVVASGYADASYDVIVESSRTARADMQLERLKTYLTVRTLAATIRGNSATLQGEYIITGGGYSPDEAGFVYSTTPTPSNGGTKITCPRVSALSCEITNLKKGTYYYQAYAKNKVGTEYGEVRSFDFEGKPVVSTLEATNITTTTATLNGSIEYAGDPAYTERGFVYSSSYPNPTVDDPATATTKVVVPGTSKEFSANIAGLTDSTTYYVRAYVKHSTGTEHGDVVEFVTLSGKPVVVTSEATNVTSTTATLNGSIEYAGDPAYSERGFVYSSSYPNPTVDDPATATTKVVVPGTSKEFSANIAGLTDNTTYYVRAYAINSTGTVYGDVIECSHSDYVVLLSDGIMVHKYDISSGATWNSANSLCNSSKLGNYSDWRLPNRGETYALYSRRTFLNLNTSIYYWLSDYNYTNSYFAVGYYKCEIVYKNADLPLRVRCVRTLK